MLAATISGLFMFGAQILVGSWMTMEEFGVFYTHIMIVNLSLIPAPGVQTIFAHDAAAMKGERGQRDLASCILGAGGLMALVWTVLVCLILVNMEQVLRTFKLQGEETLWITLLVGLLCLWFPILCGVLQGCQRFGWLGWALLINGAGRFLSMALVLALLGTRIHWLMTGALLGIILACALCLRPVLPVFARGLGRVNLRYWIPRAALMALGPGIIHYMLMVDIFVARSQFEDEISGPYAAASMVGRGLVMFIGPLSAVMFPRLVRDPSGQTLVSKVALASLVVVLVVLAGNLILCGMVVHLPWLAWLPEGVGGWFEVRHASLVDIAHLVPPFMTAMGFLALSNVYVSHLVAHRRFRRLGWLALVPCLYGAGLLLFSFTVEGLLWWLGLSNAVLLILAWYHSRRSGRGDQTE